LRGAAKAVAVRKSCGQQWPYRFNSDPGHTNPPVARRVFLLAPSSRTFEKKIAGMSSEIKCPNCGHSFEPGNAIREEVEKELRAKAADWQKKKNEEWQSKLEEERKKIQDEVAATAKKALTAEYEQQLKL